MTQKKSYSRYFIILQEDEKGYALASDKLPSGYAKLEIKGDKCKTSYYVQNLKKESAPYYMALICGKKDVKKIIKLGELNIDDHGRADVSYEYPVDSVGNSGVNVDKVIGASIVRFLNSNLISVMSGFASNEIPEWREFDVFEEEKNRFDKKPIFVGDKTLVEGKKEPSNIFDEYETQIEEKKDKKLMKSAEMQKPQYTDNLEEMSMQEYENMEEFQLEAGDDEENRHKNKCKEKDEKGEQKEHHKNNDSCHQMKEDEKKECKEKEENKYKDNDYKHHKNHAKGSVGAFFEDLSQGFEELNNFCSEIKRCNWYKVPVKRIEDMNNCSDYNKYTVVYYPMTNYYQYIRKFGHFIMGHKHDKDDKMKYLVYGIPGTKSRMDQPYGGRTGFVTWIPLKDGDEDEDSFGYWLMFYDFRNSTIVIPVK